MNESKQKKVAINLNKSQVEQRLKQIFEKAKTSSVLRKELLEWQSGERGSMFTVGSYSRIDADGNSELNTTLEFSKEFLAYLATFGPGYFDPTNDNTKNAYKNIRVPHAMLNRMREHQKLYGTSWCQVARIAFLDVLASEKHPAIIKVGNKEYVGFLFDASEISDPEEKQPCPDFVFHTEE